MGRKYKLYRPTLLELHQRAAGLRQYTGEELETQRKAAAALALPASWRTRNKLTQAEWPPLDDLHLWRSLGVSHALAFSPPRVKPSDMPHAHAYAAGYTTTIGAQMMPDQIPTKFRYRTAAGESGEVDAPSATAKGDAVKGLVVSHRVPVRGGNDILVLVEPKPAKEAW